MDDHKCNVIWEDLDKPSDIIDEVKPHPPVEDGNIKIPDDININKMIINIEQTIIKHIRLTITYFDSSIKKFILSEDEKIKIEFIDEKKLISKSGKIINIILGENNDNMLKLDCSQDSKSDIVYIDCKNIRNIEKNN